MKRVISDDLESFGKNGKSAENTKPDPLRFADVWSRLWQALESFFTPLAGLLKGILLWVRLASCCTRR